MATIASRARGSVRAELMPLIERWSRRTPGSFSDVTALAGGPVSAAAILVLRDVFISLVDARLQALYRNHFERHPAATSHAERIGALSEVRDEAFQIVRSVDWDWLAQWLTLASIGEGVGSTLWRLSNYAFECTRVNFRFTYHCNIECRHCYNSSGPKARAERIELDAMLRVIAEMPDAGVGALNLTGGEPFLYMDDLESLIRAGRAAGLGEISIYTNGFWATDPPHAHAILTRLQRAGFMRGPRDYIKVSTGIYHEEFIAFERVLTLVRTYFEMFGRRPHVDIELAPDNSGRAAEIQDQIAALQMHDSMKISFRGIAPVGRGRDLAPPPREIDSPCYVIDQIAFDPDGRARPCCGMNAENDGVSIGRLGHESLRELIKRMQNDPLLQFLAANPMSAIFEHVDVPRNLLGYAGKCALCQDALGHLRDKEALQARLFERQSFYPFWFTPG
jgi:hypothetical protein